MKGGTKFGDKSPEYFFKLFASVAADLVTKKIFKRARDVMEVVGISVRDIAKVESTLSNGRYIWRNGAGRDEGHFDVVLIHQSTRRCLVLLGRFEKGVCLVHESLQMWRNYLWKGRVIGEFDRLMLPF